jgi:hypothetical protein
VAATEIKGIAQSDVLIRAAILQALDNIYNDPRIIDQVFHNLEEDDLTKDELGARQIELAKEWFLNSHIPVVMNFRAAEEAIPCITISLQESVEAEQTHGDVHYVPQELTQGDWPALTDPFTPKAYSPTSGIMLLPDGIMGNRVVAPGMIILTRNGRQHTILENFGDNEISLAPGTSDDFTKAVIKSATARYVTTVESVVFKESYQIGLHVQNEPMNLLVLHSILKYALLKYKQELLETRGFERSQLASTDFRRNMEFDMEFVYSRFINITGYVRQSWAKTTKEMIDNTNLGPQPGDGLLVSAAGDDTDGRTDEAVNDEGETPNASDPWAVIPLDI